MIVSDQEQADQVRRTGGLGQAGKPYAEDDPQYWEGRYRYEPYPKMLYKAGVGQDYETKVVRSPQEESEAIERKGFTRGLEEARAHRDRLAETIALHAAEAKAASLKLSEQAQAEFAAAESAEGDDHVLDVPRKPGRKPKTE